MIRVESRGSIWLIDQDLGRYMRLPKHEIPRDPEWSLGWLSDLEWHPFESWWITTESFGAKDDNGTLFLYAPPTLVIRPSDSRRKVYAPDAYIQNHDVTATP
jgi:hypothetical protein